MSNVSYKKIARSTVIAKKLGKTMSKFNIIKELSDPLVNIYITKIEYWGHDSLFQYVVNNFQEVIKNEN